MSDAKAPHAELGRLILAARERKGWTRKRLAEAAGYDTRNGAITISKIERGLMRPGDEHSLKLAAALDLDRATVRDLAAGPKYNPLAAAHAARDNRRRRERLNERIALLQTEVQHFYAPWEEAVTAVEQSFLSPFLDYAAALVGAEEEIGKALVRASAHDSFAGRSASLQADIARHRHEIADSLGIGLAASAMDLAGGAALGTRLASTTYNRVAAMAKSSAGLPLNGAAQSKATLAAIGGGSRATGGFGMAGGRAVLGAFVAVPALISAGITLYGASKGWLDEAERLEAAEVAFERIDHRVRRTFDWTARAGGYLGLVQTTCGKLLHDLVGEAASLDGVSRTWAELDDTQRNAVRGLLELSAATLTVLPLPVLSAVEDVDDEPNDSLNTHLPEWNDALLEEAMTVWANVQGQAR